MYKPPDSKNKLDFDESGAVSVTTVTATEPLGNDNLPVESWMVDKRIDTAATHESRQLKPLKNMGRLEEFIRETALDDFTKNLSTGHSKKTV